MDRGVLLPAVNPWERAVGRLVLASGQMEASVLTCIQAYGDIEAAQEATKVNAFWKRVRRLKVVFQPLEAARAASLDSICNALLAAAAERNRIAHNPLSYKIEPNGLVPAIVIWGEHLTEINLEDVVRAADRIERLSAGLFLALASATGKVPKSHASGQFRL